MPLPCDPLGRCHWRHTPPPPQTPLPFSCPCLFFFFSLFLFVEAPSLSSAIKEHYGTLFFLLLLLLLLLLLRRPLQFPKESGRHPSAIHARQSSDWNTTIEREREREREREKQAIAEVEGDNERRAIQAATSRTKKKPAREF